MGTLLEQFQSVNDFDEGLTLISKFDEEMRKFGDFESYLLSLSELQDETTLRNSLKELMEFAEKYGYPYGYPSIKVLDELKMIAEKKSLQEIKDAIKQLIDKLQNSKYGYPSAQTQTSKSAETVNMFDQELCQVGDFGPNVKITEDTLKTIVKNYERFKDRIKPPLTIDHIENGPAYGWVENLRYSEGKLIGDIKEVPKQVADIIRLGGYRRFSPELYMAEIPGINENIEFPVLKCVSLLGAGIPRMKDLKDANVLYNSEDKGIGYVLFSENEDNIQIGGDMKEKIDVIEKKVQSIEQENIQLKVEKFMETHSEQIIPAVAPLVKSILLETYNDEKVVKFSEDGKDKEVKIGNAIMELIDKLPKYVEFSEKGKDNPVIDEKLQEAKLVEEFAETHKVSKEVAYERLKSEGKVK